VSIVVMLTTHANVPGLVALLRLIFAVRAFIWLARWGEKTADEDGMPAVAGGGALPPVSHP
jgi:hypothetical protein